MPSPPRALAQFFRDAGLPEPAVTHHRMPVELEGLLNASFPNPGDREAVRELVLASLADDGMGVGTRCKADKVYFSYPIALLVSASP